MTGHATQSRLEAAKERHVLSRAAPKLAVTASVVAVAADLVLMVIIGEAIPPLAVFGLLTLLAVALAARRPRAGLVTLGILAFVAAAGSAPFLAADLSSPSDPIAFVYGVLSGGGRLVALVAVGLALGRRDEAARPVGRASLIILAVAVIFSGVARGTASSDVAQDGDVEVLVSGFEFPEHVTADAGGSLLLDNRDVLRHTFTVEDTGTDILLEPRATRRIPLDLPPGTYTYVCTVPGHESMTGTLEVQ